MTTLSLNSPDGMRRRRGPGRRAVGLLCAVVVSTAAIVQTVSPARAEAPPPMNWPAAIAAAQQAPIRTTPVLAPPEPSDPAVSHLQIPITDPGIGPLTFDALAAGDPALAATGHLVLLLHGFPESSESFRAILPRLAAAGYYAVAPNLRGYSPGARPLAVADYALPHSVDDTTSMATALGANRFHVVGHDWGAAVAWLTAGLHPERVSSLTALSIPHPQAMREAVDDPTSPQRAMFSYISPLKVPGIEYLLDAFGPGFFAQVLRLMGCPQPYADRYAVGVQDPAVLGLALNWYRANPVPPEIVAPVVDVPTTFLWGARDFAISRAAAEATQHYVTGPYTFIELDDVDHFVPENATAAVTDAVLAQLGAAG